MKQRSIRIGVIMTIAFAIAFVIFAKMLYVQVLANERFSNESLHNRLQEVSVTPDRGLIYDSKGEALAISVEKDSVYITPSVIRNSSKRDQMVEDLANSLHMSKEDVNQVVDRTSGDFAWLKRYADDSEVATLKELDYLGVGFTKEYQRAYPKNNLASHVLGFAGTDNTGLAGIEQSQNNVLKGNEGKLVVEYDNAGNIIPQSIRSSIPASPGNNIHLTIDSTVQYIVERELNNAQKTLQAAEMTCIVMDVNTGKVLAMANLPDYDPNNYGKYAPETWTNLAISKVYEPGSTFKSMVASMYLEDDIAEPDTQYTCNGFVNIDGQELRCWIYPKAHGHETLRSGVANSCNVVMVEGVLKLGIDRFYDYMKGFGMTKRTGIELPGESSPLIVNKNNAVRFDLAAQSIGQGNAFTPIQIITGISAVANGGILYQPQIIDEVTDRSGKTVSKTEPQVVRRAISADTSAQMREFLEAVVTEGIGKQSAVPGYRVVGKTGTGEIAESGKYIKGEYNLSFVGFAPADAPKVACLVVVNKPKVSSDSGTVVGPIFSAIMADVLQYYGVPKTSSSEKITQPTTTELVTVPTLSLPMNAEAARQAFVQAGLSPTFVVSGDTLCSYLPAAGTQVAQGSKIELYAKYGNAETVAMPNLVGKTIKDADRVLRGFSLTPVMEGSGIAYRQAPAAGASVPLGSQVQLWFASSRERSDIERATSQAATDAAEAQKKAENENKSDDATPASDVTDKPTGSG